MPSLPTKLDKWYQVQNLGWDFWFRIIKITLNKEFEVLKLILTTFIFTHPQTGWTPQTKDIPDISGDWDGKSIASQGDLPTLRLDGLQILSPLQVGGGKLTEGNVLPAQLGGVPCIPGSCLRGALRHWLKIKWSEIENENTNEHKFWKGLLAEDLSGWKPKAIRFETSFPKRLQAFPLHPQQDWQVFGVKSHQLAVQWQFPAIESGKPGQGLSIAVYLREEITKEQKQWLETRLREMLSEQGIGKGKASGFGRVGIRLRKWEIRQIGRKKVIEECDRIGQWEIKLTGMKPAILPRDRKKDSEGTYRWNPQVLRACLRGYFTRLALTLMSKEETETLTNIVFGGLGKPARLFLTSYLVLGKTESKCGMYANISKDLVKSTWVIWVDCNYEFRELVDGLLKLASQLGGLGSGWRRPPHSLRKGNVYRGSEFEVTAVNHSEAESEDVENLIEPLQGMIRDLAEKYHLNLHPTQSFEPGRLISIWEGEEEAWKKIVHGACSTNEDNRPDWAKKRPLWCGDTKKRPSGYAVREYVDCCLITVFDSAVEDALENHLQGFRKIWPPS